MMRRIELLAPAKDYETARAAIDCGADAVYMGGARFGARAGACNSIEDVARAVEYAHQFGAKLYVTLNTLLHEGELHEAEIAARELVAIGVDALIVQDMAYARMGLEVELHASTQMCNMTPEGVRFLSDVGFSRVVLERNLTLEQIREIGEASDVELEIFIHGAICVGYSGRCYLSRAITPSRSGNRGECSQSCRLSYDLCGGEGERIIESKHLLSVQDFNLTEHIGDLLDCGATSFKVEGRLKDINYTRNIIAHYRRIIDEEIAKREGLTRVSCGEYELRSTPLPEKSFSRGKTTYMLGGKGGKRGKVASFDTPKVMGEMLGEVVKMRGNMVGIKAKGVTLSSGDGVCYMTREGLMGCSINNFSVADLTWLDLNKMRGIEVGTVLYRNYDRAYERVVENLCTPRLIAVSGSITTTPQSAMVEYHDEEGYIARATIEGEFTEAKNRDKMVETIKTQLAKCGGTIFEAREIDTTSWGGEFLTSANLNALRREALERLREERLRGANDAPHKIFRERSDIPHPTKELDGAWSVTNSVARGFYLDHGVEKIAESYELAEDLTGACVMRSAYCIRREIGECLKMGSRLRGPLYLERGAHRFRLDFDCARCEMSLIKM